MTKDIGASASADQALVNRAQGRGPTDFDPSRMAALAKELSDLRDHIKGSWDDVAKSEADAGWYGGWGIEERLSACMFIGKQTTVAVYQALDRIVAAIAIEAHSDTTGTGVAEGESAAIAQKGKP